MRGDGREMAEFWNERAKENALYFIDNTLAYSDSDEATFWANGERELDVLLEAVGIELHITDRVLEIGCGVGRMTRAIAARAGSVTGLDASSEMLAGARERNGHIPNVDWRHGDGETLSAIPDASVTACLSHVVFQHIPDPQTTLGYIQEIGRVLKRGGWTAFQVSNDPHIHRWRWGPEQWRVRIASLFGRAPRKQSHRAWRGSAVALGDVRAAARDGGMDVERVSGEGTQLCYVLARKH
ncbi:MAG: methyltransferase domain-containing protein [Thermoleophilaceae bacterium]